MCEDFHRKVAFGNYLTTSSSSSVRLPSVSSDIQILIWKHVYCTYSSTCSTEKDSCGVRPILCFEKSFNVILVHKVSHPITGSMALVRTCGFHLSV